MNKLRQIIVVGFLTLTATISFSAYAAANLISIITADTKASNIGPSVVADFNSMRTEMQTVANYSGLSLKEVLIQGKSTTPANLIKQLDSIQANPDDVIVFYYSGHGFRTESKNPSPWPNLYFSLTNEGMEYEYIMHKLLEKKPRFLITIADVCNSFWPNDYSPKMAPRGMKVPGNQEKVRTNIKHLFLDDAGMINITSAKISETAWGNDDGGRFTHAFINNLTKETETASVASWNHLLKEAAKEVTQETTRAHSHVKPQHPYYELNNKYPK